MSDTIDPGDDEGQFTIKQGVKEIIVGIKQGGGDPQTGEGGDYSRISAYRGKDEGLHTGSKSPTTGRHGEPFGNKG